MSTKLDQIRDEILEPSSRDPALAMLRDRARRLVPGTGSPDARVMVVGEAPGATEDARGPFMGASGIMLDQLLAVAGLQYDACWITNLVKYRLPMNRDPFYAEAITSASYLRREIAIISPEVVVLCEKWAYQALFPMASVTGDHGKMLKAPWDSSGRWFMPTASPARCLRDQALEWQSVADFRLLGTFLHTTTTGAAEAR